MGADGGEDRAEGYGRGNEKGIREIYGRKLKFVRFVRIVRF